jgi:heme-degrading monooxygenase HmoA
VGVIARLWRGWAAVSNRQAYPRHFHQGVLPELKRIDGFLGASLLEREENGEVEFLVVTRWSSRDAIRAFAGDDVSKAIVEPEARAALIRFDETVRHYEESEGLCPSGSLAGG